MSNLPIIPLENSDGYIWFDGSFVKFQDAKIHVLTHSLHYAGGVFEGEKAINGKVFSIEKHTERLFQSAKIMGLNIPYSPGEIIDATNELLQRNNLKNAYVRPFAWRSTSALMVRAQNPQTHLIIAAWEPRGASADLGLKLMVSKWVKPTEAIYPVQCKSSAQYTMLAIAVNEAVLSGYNEAIMLDVNGYIAECTTSNLFFIKDDRLYTPKTDFCLNGITRQTVIAMARKNNIEVFEENIDLNKLASFDAAFLTGTASGLKKIYLIKSQDLEVHYAESTIYNLLQREYRKLLESTV